MGEAGSDRAEGGEDNEGEELKCCCMTIGASMQNGGVVNKWQPLLTSWEWPQGRDGKGRLSGSDWPDPVSGSGRQLEGKGEKRPERRRDLR